MATLCPDSALAQLLADRDRYAAFLRRRVGAAAAEDILQNVYLRIVERGVSVRDATRLSSWFYSVLRNATIDHMRSCTRRSRLTCQLASEPVSEVPASDDSGDSIAREMIATLDPTHREALETVYTEGGSISTLAAKSGISRNAATVRVHRARQALGGLLATTCRSRR